MPRVAGAPSSRAHFRPRTEALEGRLLLSISPGGDTTSGGHPAYLAQATAAAEIDFEGPDLKGKDGPFGRIGLDLAQVYEEQKAFKAAGGDTTAAGSAGFVPSSSLLQVRNNTVAIDVSATGSIASLEPALTAIGMTIKATGVDVASGWLPITALPQLASLDGLDFARPSYKPITRAGAVTSQGDVSMHSDMARSKFAVDGTGVTVGVLSDSFNVSGKGSAAADIASGDLPAAGVNVLAEGSGEDEGRAMSQIVHDVAPGASIAFATAGNSEAEFAANIRALQSKAGAQVIVDDVAFFSEPFFQDGMVAQAVDDVVSKGATYFSAAGNEGTNGYAAAFTASTTTGPGGGKLHDFGGGAAGQPVTIPVGSSVQFAFQWNQPFKSLGGAGSQSDMNVYLVDGNGNVVAKGIANTLGGDPVQIMAFGNDGSIMVGGQPDTTFKIEFELVSGPAPTQMEYLAFGPSGGFFINQFDTAPPTSFGHPQAAGAIGVGASAFFQTPAFGQTPPLLNSYSSLGGMPIYFGTAGKLLATPAVRQSPVVTGPDGADTTFFGQSGSFPQDTDNFPNFFGTSAAAPHVAAVAALMIQASKPFGTLSPADIRSALQANSIAISGRSDPFNPGTVTPITGSGYNFFAGAGLVDAFQAVQSVSNRPPVAVDDTADTLQETPVAIDVTANDTDPNNNLDPTTVAIVTQPAHGTLSIDPSTGVVTYSPAANFFGADAFTYTVADTLGAVSNVAHVAITVHFVNKPPMAVTDVVSTDPGVAVTIDALANDFDPDGGHIVPASLTIVQQPGSGTASIVNGQIVYTPQSGFIGGDEILYSVTDDDGGAISQGTILIRVGAAVSISGLAYVDANANGVKDSGEFGIAGVSVILSKTDGPFTFSKTITTLPDGSFQFAGGSDYIMPQGVYSLHEIHPAFFVDGPDKVGTPASAGPNGNNAFNNLSLAAGQNATGYEFGERGANAAFAAAFFNRRTFLASSVNTGTPTLNLAQGGIWVSFDAGIQGTLAELAQAAPGKGSVTLTLFDSSLHPVASTTSADGSAQLSFTGNSSQPYFLQATGTNTQVSLNSYIAPVVATNWHNAQLPGDVNNDHAVTALDALLIINQLNAGKFGKISGLNGLGSYLVDVNNDGLLSALDALNVINVLNSKAGPVKSAANTSSSSSDNSAVAFSLAADRAMSQWPAATTSAALATPTVGATAASSVAASNVDGSAVATPAAAPNTVSVSRPTPGAARLAELIWSDQDAWQTEPV